MVETNPPHVIELDGATNFRDLGGYQARYGRVRTGEVYRSSRLSALSDEDLVVLSGLGIRTVVTLLTDEDAAEYGPDRLPAGAQLVSLPIDSETATELANRARAALATGDFSALPPELNEQIHRLLIDDGQRQYGELIRLVTDPDNRPLVFHCSHGVHRTGTGAAILLTLLGVPWTTVRDDYLASNRCRQAEVGARLEQMRHAAAATLGIDAGAVDMTNMEAFMVQAGSYIDASRTQVLDRFGSFDDYATDAMGVEQAQLDRLRSQLLVRDPAGDSSTPR